MPNIEIEFSIECSNCGHSLEVKIGEDYKGFPALAVEPCESCIDSAREEGIEIGKEDE